MRASLAAAIALIGAGTPALAHDGVVHATAEEARKHAAARALPAPTPLPFDMGGPFTLEASTGKTRTQTDPDGRMQMLFFGYASCEQICSAALPMMGDVVDRVAVAGHAVRPVMITVDPQRDTADLMADRLAFFHPDFVGLTGTPDQLQVAYDAFGITPEVVLTDHEDQPVFAHGSFIFLLDGDGTVLTLIPPVMDPERAAEIVTNYATGS